LTLTHPIGFYKGDTGGAGNQTVFPSKNDYADFDGVDDYVVVPNDSAFLPNEITVSFWAKFDDVSSATLKSPVGVWDYSGNERSWGFYFQSSNASLNWAVSSDGTFAGSGYKRTHTSALSAGVWYHIVGTFSAGTIGLFINGTSNASTPDGTATSIYTSNTTDLLVGAHYDGATPVRFNNGIMSDLRVYSRVLTSGEITYLYSRGASGTDPTNTNLVGHWKFDEGEGSVITDSSGNGNDGTAVNITEPEFWDSGANFDGVDDLVDCGDTSTFSFGDGSSDSPFSVAAWVKFDTRSTGVMGIIDKATGVTGGEWYLVQTATDEIMLAVIDDSAVGKLRRLSTNSPIDAVDKWFHIVATYDGIGSAATEIKMYVNSVEVSYSDTSTGTYTAMEDTSISLKIGDTRGGSDRFNGQMYDVRIYSDVLTTSEVTYLYTAGASGTNPTTTNLVGRWKLDDGDGAVVADSSGNGNDGVATNIEEPAFWNQPHANFDGVNDYVGMGNVLDFERTDSFSISTWAKLHTGDFTTNVLVSKMANVIPFRGYLLWARGSGSLSRAIQFLLRSSHETPTNVVSVVTPNNVWDVDEWVHVVATYNGNSLASGVKIYIDSVNQVLDIEQDSLSNSTLNSNPFNIGSRNDGGNPIDGQISDVRIYNDVLTASEVTYLYTAGASGTDPTDTNLVGHWKLDDRYGTNVKDYAGVNDGTAYNITESTFWVQE